VSPRNKYEPVTTPELTTTTTIISSTIPIDITMKLPEHSTEVINHMEISLLTMTTEGNNQNDTLAPIGSTMIYSDETTTEQHIITSTEKQVDYMTTTDADINTRQPIELTSQLSSVYEATSSTPRLIHLLTNSSQFLMTEEITQPSTTTTTTITEIATHLTASFNPCTLENLRANFVYHEYPLDKHKFVFCDSEGKMNIIACSPNYVWSQSEQSCVLPG
ncbi:unnamed protein product, partial [Adineta ricciae]